MRPCPDILIGTAWEAWIAEAPEVEYGEDVDDYHRAAMEWFRNTPGHNSHPDEAQKQALIAWIESCQLALLRAKNPEPPLGEDRLKTAFWTLVGAVAGVSIWKTLGLTTLLPAPVAVGVALGLVALGYAGKAILHASKSGRRWRMLNQIDMRLETLKHFRKE
jgi:hypothetical protein